ncbi:MAG: hypothetical protein ACQEVT_09410 [Pseudomonadota bacterium]|uniref:hypothetical protein n=1 Tax=Roseovarius TaxID=74030 RepID=UPI0022A83D62|nr:hypothetical protein [Roseovarius sp. EGI FJ00037]MCZ0812959.1 hypothetical protein [Roseovarius sp. EGI FJ00037]
MKYLALTAALALLAAPVSAGQCPMDMAKIDEAMQSASLSEADMAEVKDLRAKGEDLHKSGDHAASVETLARAKEMLGVE